MGVVTRPIVTQPSNPAFDAGWVFTFRKCPECKSPLNIENETDSSFDFSCLGCSVEGNVNMGGINGK